MFHKRGMLQCLLPNRDKAMWHQRRTEKNLSYTGFSAALEWHWLPRTVNPANPLLPWSFLFLGSGRSLVCVSLFSVTSAGCTLLRLQDAPWSEILQPCARCATGLMLSVGWPVPKLHNPWSEMNKKSLLGSSSSLRNSCFSPGLGFSLCPGLGSDTISLNSAMRFEWRLIMSGLEAGETPHSDNRLHALLRCYFMLSLCNPDWPLGFVLGYFFPSNPCNCKNVQNVKCLTNVSYNQTPADPSLRLRVHANISVWEYIHEL